MPRKSLVVLCAVMIVLVGCGSSKKSSSTSSGSASSSSSTGDKVKAGDINLKADDFPSDWTSTPSNSATSSATDKNLYSCSGLPDPATNTTAAVSSPDFAKGTFTQASSEVRFAKSKDVANKVLDAFKSDKFQSCLQQTIDAQIKVQASSGGATVGASKIESLAAPSGTDAAAAFRMTTPITAFGQTITFYIDFAVLQKGRAVVTLSVSNGNSPFDSALKGELTAKLISRMASNA
jgi:hypothetical protein